ncbi:MAG: peptide chain release factor N(5)-glutamine methyltransferase [Clostridiales bacterium]|nr:peptide chain release factor N(5)-glutamine methyltransferase [Clostridiales bacterium]
MTLLELYTEGRDRLEAAGILTDAAIDARELLLAAFSMSMTQYLLNRDRELPDDQASQTAWERYQDMIGQRSRRIPLQQILGKAEFMGLEFEIDNQVLVPRQDTETLVEQVLADCHGLSMLDLCTGSGCIAVSLAVHGDFAKITATDLSDGALQVAKRNAERHAPGRLVFYQGDLFDALPESGEKYDVITANPPYIPTDVIGGLEPEVKIYEPRLALDGHEDGLYFYRRILSEAGDYLAPDGRIYFEIGYDQAEPVTAIAKAEGYRTVRTCRDLAGNDRVVILER